LLDSDPLGTAVLKFSLTPSFTSKMPAAASLKSKQQYNDRFCKLLDSHERAFLVHADNVGSRQFMDIRTVRAAARLTPPAAKTVPTLFSRVFGSRAPSRPLRAPCPR
jgi:hypothetical protein